MDQIILIIKINEDIRLGKPISKVYMAPELERLLNSNLNSPGKPIFTSPIRLPREGLLERIHERLITGVKYPRVTAQAFPYCEI